MRKTKTATLLKKSALKKNTVSQSGRRRCRTGSCHGNSSSRGHLAARNRPRSRPHKSGFDDRFPCSLYTNETRSVYLCGEYNRGKEHVLRGNGTRSCRHPFTNSLTTSRLYDRQEATGTSLHEQISGNPHKPLHNRGTSPACTNTWTCGVSTTPTRVFPSPPPQTYSGPRRVPLFSTRQVDKHVSSPDTP